MKFNKDPKDKDKYVVSLTTAGIANIQAVDSNYDFTAGDNVTGSYEIKAAGATYTLSGTDSKTYDVLGSYSVTLSNGESYDLKAGDLQFNKDAKDKGKYVVSLTAAGISNIQAVDSNYDFTAGDDVTGSYEIKVAGATYTLSGTDSKTYDGKTTKIDDVLDSYSVTLSNGESYMLKAGDLQFNKDPKDKDKYVVSLTAAGIANIQAVDSNYDFTAAGATYTLSGTDSKTYDGKTTKIDDVLGSYTVTLSNGESYTLKVGDLQFNKDPKDKDKYVVSLTAAGIANIKAVDSNYDFTAGDDVTGSYEIKAASATYTLSGTDSKTYDGKTTKIDDVLGSYTVTLSNGESYTLKAGDLQFNKDPKDKDKYVVSLTAAGIANIQSVDSNYDFTAGDDVTGSYEIKAASATYTLSGTDSKTYDGKTTKIDDVLSSYSVTLSNGESYTLKAGDLQFNKDPKDKDKYVVSLTAAGIANIKAVDSNYDFTAGDDVTGSYEIKAASATYTLSGTDSKTYDGKTTKIDDVLSSYSVTLSNGESYTLKAGDLQFNKDPKDKDKYVVSLTAAGIANIQSVDSNYDFTAGDDVTGSYEIKAAGATYTLSGTDSKTYDGKTTKIDDVLGSYSVTLSNGESYTLKAGDLKFNKDPKDKGKYVVSLTAAGIANIQAVDSNYDFTAGDDVTGSYEIKAASATYTLSGADSKTYDGKTTKIDDILGSYIITLSNGETYQLQNGDLEFDGDARNVGAYTVRLTASGLKHVQMLNPNYDLVAKGQNPTFNIEKKKVTITVGNVTKQVGAKDPDFNANVDGLISGDKLAYELTREPGEKAGQYVINAAMGANDNYDVQVIPGKLTIKAAPEKITGTVTVHYVAGGRFIHADNHLKGIVGDGYEVKALSIPGYTLKRVVGEANGKFDGSKVITFYYTVDYTGVPQTPNGKPIPGIKPIKGTSEPGSPIHAPEIPGYQFIGQAVIPNQPGQVALIYKAIEKPGHNGGGSHGTKEPNVKPEVIKPITPINNSKKTVKESTTAPLKSNSTAKRLPQTGDKEQEDSELFGLGIMALLGTLGLVILKKRRSDD